MAVSPRYVPLEKFGVMTPRDMQSALRNLRTLNKHMIEQIATKESKIAQTKKAFQNLVTAETVTPNSAEDSSSSIAPWRSKCEAAETAFSRHKYARSQLQREILHTARHIRVIAQRVKELADDIQADRLAAEKRERDMEMSRKTNYLSKWGFGNFRRNSSGSLEKKWYEEELPGFGPPSEGAEECEGIDEAWSMSEPEPLSMEDSSFNVLMWRYKQRAKDLILNKSLRNPSPTWLTEMKQSLKNQVIIRHEGQSPHEKPTKHKDPASMSDPQVNRPATPRDDVDAYQMATASAPNIDTSQDPATPPSTPHKSKKKPLKVFNVKTKADAKLVSIYGNKFVPAMDKRNGEAKSPTTGQPPKIEPRARSPVFSADPHNNLLPSVTRSKEKLVVTRSPTPARVNSGGNSGRGGGEAKHWHHRLPQLSGGLDQKRQSLSRCQN